MQFQSGYSADRENNEPIMTLRHSILLAFVMFAGFLIVSQIYLVIPLIGEIANRFQIVPANAALVGSAFGFAYAAGFLVFGPLSDRLGRRRVLVLGLAATAIATAVASVAQSFTFLIIARAIQGFAASTFPPAALSLVAEELPPQNRPFGISLLSFAFLGAAPLSQLLSASLGGGLAEIMLYITPLYLVAAAGLYAVTRSGETKPATSNTAAGNGSWTLFQDAGILAAWLAAGTVLFGFVAFHTGTQALGATLNINLQNLRLVGIPTLLLTFAAAPIIRAYGAPVPAVIGLSVASIGLGLAVLGEPILLYATSALLSAGVALAVPGLIATVASRASNSNRGLAMAIYSFLLFLGASMAPPVAQILAIFSPTAVWLLPASLFAVAAVGLKRNS